MIENDAPEHRPGKPLPGFRSVRDAIAAALPALSPPARITVSEAATRRRVNAGGQWMQWDNDVAPYMVEPMDATMSRRFEAAVFVGPARSSKTESMIINPWVHSVLASPRLASIFYMSQAAAREWSIEELGPIIKNSPELRRLLRTDNVHEKTFQGGARLTIDWPTDNKLSGRSIPLPLFADYDQKAYQNVEGQGPAFAMGRKRTTQAGTRGMAVAESSPRFPVLDETWQPKTPHEAPPCEGILGLYNTGTRGRYYWTCPDCKGDFEPTFNRLEFQKEGTASARGKSAVMVCIHCGSVLEPRFKSELNRGGRWLHESNSGELVPLGDLVRDTDVVSWWAHGPIAALTTWSKIVTKYLEGVEEFNRTGDEKPLQAATNLDLGLPYTPRAMSSEAVLTESGLREDATDHGWQVAPAQVRFLLASVDVQNGRFVVQVTAHLADGERVIIDRFDIHTPPSTAPRHDDRQINPARYAEDWDALLDLATMSYPVANADHRIRILGCICDSQGSPGVTPNAYAAWRRFKKIRPRWFHLQRPAKSNDAKRVEVKAPETAHRGKRHVAKDVLMVYIATNRLKDEIAAGLARTERGARAIHIPVGAPQEIFAEFAAERRTPKGWEKRPGVDRNEALDLAVYDLALYLALGGEKVNWTAPPAWAVIGPGNAFAVQPATLAAQSDAVEESPPEKPQVRKRRTTRRGARRFDGW